MICELRCSWIRRTRVWSDISVWRSPILLSQKKTDPDDARRARAEADYQTHRAVIQLSEAAPGDKQKEVAEDIANLLGKGEYESVLGYFDPQLKQTLSAIAIEQGWGVLIAQTGEFDSVVRSQAGSAQGFDVVDVLCSTHQAGLVVRVVPGLLW
jgi:hypothetical protein